MTLMRGVRPVRLLRQLVALTVALVVAASGCSRPVPPTISPERVVVTGLSSETIDVDVTLSVSNPNGVDLVAQSLTGHVVVGGHVDLGTVEIPVTTVFPSHKTAKLDAPLRVKLQDVPSLAALSLSTDKIPFAVDGKVGVGGDLLSVDVPYHLEGTLGRANLVRALGVGLPGLSR